MKNAFVVAVALCAAGVLAMPTKDELTKAQPLVAELMAPVMADFKAAVTKDKAAAAVKVADTSVGFAEAAETEAAKFLLLKGAVNFYTRGEAYDKAADAVADLQAKVKDVPSEVIAEITGKATGKISETKAPRLFALYRMAKLQVRAASEAKALALKLKKVKSDALQRRYAEALAGAGDWKAAYGEFAKLSDAKLVSVVDAESKGKAKNAETGEFWWAYKPDLDGMDEIFKSHAAMFYRKALAAGEIAGLKKNIVEQRIRGIVPEASQSVGESPLGVVERSVSAKGVASAGANKAGSAWQEKGNTATLTLKNGEKLEFVKCKPGEVEIRLGNMWDRSSKKVSITRPFWVMVRPLTNRDVRDYSSWKTHKVPEEGVDYVEGFHADAMGFAKDVTEEVRQLLPKGYVVRLPSYAEWDYSYHANSEDAYDPYNNFKCAFQNNKARVDAVLGAQGKGGRRCLDGKTTKNAWGLHEYSREKLLDRVDDENSVPNRAWRKNDKFDVTPIKNLKEEFAEDKDPLFWSEVPDAYHLWRGQSDWNGFAASLAGSNTRLVVGPDLVSEWKAKHAKK